MRIDVLDVKCECCKSECVVHRHGTHCTKIAQGECIGVDLDLSAYEFECLNCDVPLVGCAYCRALGVVSSKERTERVLAHRAQRELDNELNW
jgi:hypothetical protein